MKNNPMWRDPLPAATYEPIGQRRGARPASQRNGHTGLKRRWHDRAHAPINGSCGRRGGRASTSELRP